MQPCRWGGPVFVAERGTIGRCDARTNQLSLPSRYPPDAPYRWPRSFAPKGYGLPEKSTIERVVELARVGPCEDVQEIHAQLARERYSDIMEQMTGPMIRSQRTALIRQTDRNQH